MEEENVCSVCGKEGTRFDFVTCPWCEEEVCTDCFMSDKHNHKEDWEE